MNEEEAEYEFKKEISDVEALGWLKALVNELKIENIEGIIIDIENFDDGDRTLKLTIDISKDNEGE